MREEEVKILNLQGSQLSSLPKNFSFNGTLDLTGSSLQELPESMFIQEDLIINMTKIKNLSENSIVGGDIYCNNKIHIPASSLICGKIFCNGVQIARDTEYNGSQPYLMLNNGDRFYYKKKKFINRSETNDYNEPNRVSVEWYCGFSPRTTAVKFTIFNNTYCIPCKNIREGVLLADYQLALDRGLDKYKDLDIHKKITVPELINIYSTASNPCASGQELFFKNTGIKMDEVFSIYELGQILSKYRINRSIPSIDVFFKFFNLNNNEEEAK